MKIYKLEPTKIIDTKRERNEAKASNENRLKQA
jgi:hypothetical protein